MNIASVRTAVENSDQRAVSVHATGLSKVYVKGGKVIRVLDKADLHLKAGERVSIVGPSGCGKSTFLHLLGLLDRPSLGTLRFGDVDVTRAPETVLHRIRNRDVGFVFQSHMLLPEHTALSNVMMPARLGGASTRQAAARATALLGAVGLGGRLNHRPGELSGGEQQRVAIARAMVMGPGLILADEPTGNLDPSTAGGVFELLLDLHRQLGCTLVVVTHSMELSARFPRRLSLIDGRFIEDAP
ncbi:MAG: ABC transporter ATP-binding protein [Myxococcota bacterium]